MSHPLQPDEWEGFHFPYRNSLEEVPWVVIYVVVTEYPYIVRSLTGIVRAATGIPKPNHRLL